MFEGFYVDELVWRDGTGAVQHGLTELTAISDDASFDRMIRLIRLAREMGKFGGQDTPGIMSKIRFCVGTGGDSGLISLDLFGKSHIQLSQDEARTLVDWVNQGLSGNQP